MKIRIRLLILFVLLFSVLLSAFAFFIYLSTAQSRKEEYYKHLNQEAITKANLLLDGKLPQKLMQVIYKNSGNSLFEEEVAIYDTSFHLLYHDAVEIDKVKETRAMIDRIIALKQITFEQGNLQVVGLLYHHKNRLYVITAAAVDQYGLARLHNLQLTLIISFLFIIILTIVSGYFFVGRALEPVARIVDNVETITATNLDLRIPVRNKKDEIGELATTFNKMLDRLEKSFEAQKSFISNVSHELRTPLATLIGELQIALTKERKTTEYQKTIKIALSDARQLVKLSNGLLDLAKASFDRTEITFKKIRVDEMLMDAQAAVLRFNPKFKVDIVFEQEIDDERFISVNGNEYLLRVAFINLMENACKFSDDHQCDVTIKYHENILRLDFKDQGIGIDQVELASIFNAFYRGKNKDKAPGNGIGLSLIERIVNMHGGTVTVNSVIGKGTIFMINLPHL